MKNDMRKVSVQSGIGKTESEIRNLFTVEERNLLQIAAGKSRIELIEELNVVLDHIINDNDMFEMITGLSYKLNNMTDEAFKESLIIISG